LKKGNIKKRSRIEYKNERVNKASSRNSKTEGRRMKMGRRWLVIEKE
jgi:hypothetical protein